ncbi:MAG: hypothetical protein Roseis2KO_08620 [Roseivirga sp.]
MKRSKKIFVVVGVLFVLGVCAVTYDIFTRTSLPGSKKYLKESILPSDESEAYESDSTGLPTDSTDVANTGNR